MLAGAGVLPSTFDPSEFTEDRVAAILLSGKELLRMIEDGDPNSEDQTARDTYRTYFRTAPTVN